MSMSSCTSVAGQAALVGAPARAVALSARVSAPLCAQPPGEQFEQDAASFLDPALPKGSGMLPDMASAGDAPHPGPALAHAPAPAAC